MSMPSQAILIAPGTFWHWSQDTPAELMQLRDRPLLRHTMDTLAALDCRRIDVVLGTAPERFEELLGDGTRWGLDVRYHLPREAERPYARIAAIPIDEADVLFAHACTLPVPRVLREGRITGGWGVIPRGTLRAIPVGLEVDRVEAWLAARWELSVPLPRDQQETLDVRTAAGFLRAQETLLAGGRPDLLRTGRERSPGVWVGWNAQIHPLASLTGPVYIGERATVGAGAEIGPNAAVGDDAIVAAGASVSGASIQPGTYVGDTLSVRCSIAREGWLMDVEVGGALSITDRLLLGATYLDPAVPIAIRSVVRLVAAVAWIMSLPVQVATGLYLRLTRPGPVLFRAPVHTIWRGGRTSGPRSVEIVSFDPALGRMGPIAVRAAGYADFFLRFLPGLLLVARGDLALVGLEPRAPDDVALLPPRWRATVNAFPPGLVTPVEETGGLVPPSDAVFAAEAFLVAHDSFRFKARLLARYLWRRLMPGRRLSSGASRRSPLEA